MRNGVELDPEQRRIAQDISEGLRNLPRHEGTVWRGAQLTEEQIARYVPGTTITEPAMTSTTRDRGMMIPGNVEFIIHSETGRDISALSARPNELEVLNGGGTEYEVRGVVRDKGNDLFGNTKTRIYLYEKPVESGSHETPRTHEGDSVPDATPDDAGLAHELAPAEAPSVMHGTDRTAIGDDPEARRVFGNLRNEGEHDVIVHGNRFGRPVPGNEHESNPQHIVDAIRDNPNYVEGTPVRLIACFAGNEIGWAQHVADELGVPVRAPSDSVGVNQEPNSPAEVHGGGEWKVFHPTERLGGADESMRHAADATPDSSSPHRDSVPRSPAEDVRDRATPGTGDEHTQRDRDPDTSTPDRSASPEQDSSLARPEDPREPRTPDDEQTPHHDTSEETLPERVSEHDRDQLEHSDDPVPHENEPAPHDEPREATPEHPAADEHDASHAADERTPRETEPERTTAAYSDQSEAAAVDRSASPESDMMSGPSKEGRDPSRTSDDGTVPVRSTESPLRRVEEPTSNPGEQEREHPEPATAAPHDRPEPELTPIEQAAKDACDRLPQAERDALEAYAGSAYNEINRHLRHGEEMGWVSPETIDLIRSGLEKLPNHVGTVKRSIMLSPEEMEKFWYNNRVGNIVEDPGFVSTSKTRFKWNPNVKLTIKSATGKDISFVRPPGMRGEQEVLIPDGRQFRVLDRQMSPDGVLEVTWQEIAETSQATAGNDSDLAVAVRDLESDIPFPSEAIVDEGVPFSIESRESTVPAEGVPPDTPSVFVHPDVYIPKMRNAITELVSALWDPARASELPDLRSGYARVLTEAGLYDQDTAMAAWQQLSAYDPELGKYIAENHAALLPSSDGSVDGRGRSVES
ncbi:ADP-ribosyltransferase [Nocardia macrotermitis]|nr:ADP-ribosyltransferase [Nocardia macrotermitis]